MIDTVDSPYIHTATSENFNQVVIENSHKGPVLVNFWSKKAGPCLRQYPILDQIIHKYNGLLLLVNIDTETEILISKDYGIASVPTLKLYRDGEVHETCHGYQSESEIVKTIEQYIVRDSDKIIVQAIQLYANGGIKDAYELITNGIIGDPENPRLPLAICKLLKHEKRYDEAISLLESLPPNIKDYYEIKPFHSLVSFLVQMDESKNIDSLLNQLKSSPDNLEVKKQLSIHYVISQQYDQALVTISEIMHAQQNYNNSYPKKAMLDLFTMLGENHPLVGQYRSSLRRYTH